MTTIIDFLEDKIPHPRLGLYNSEFLKMSSRQWDIHHDFIQWIFPTDTPSKYNPDAPLISVEDWKLLSDQAKINFKMNLWKFCSFFALVGEEEYNHWFLRLVRVYESCYFVLGYEYIKFQYFRDFASDENWTILTPYAEASVQKMGQRLC